MVTAPAMHIAAVLLLSSVCASSGKGFLVRNHKSLSSVDATLDQDLQIALGEVMGCGSMMLKGRLSSIEQALAPMWYTLPKTRSGRIEWRSLRYMVHRYFMQQSSLQIRGFEQNRVLNSSDAAFVGTLGKRMPTYVEALLGGRKMINKGFSLQDSAALVATLEQLIFDSETELLEKVYAALSKDTKRSVSFQGMKIILESYMIHWMVGDDQEGINALMENATLAQEALPHWTEVLDFLEGAVKMHNFERLQAPAQGQGKNTWANHYVFHDTHQIVGGITRSFASYWEDVCTGMRNSLVALDRSGTGRVHLADFYRAGINEEWRFGESEAYLREMGVLDESASWHGKQVIIANYLQAASNCIISSPHYLVCCQNPCEQIMGEIETKIASPMASMDQIVEVVSNITYDDEGDELVVLDEVLIQQLQQISALHAGNVPIHGRLFTQWLHFVFPHACPFPHKAGSFSMASPTEFGEDYIASPEEMRNHAKDSYKVQQRTKNATDLEEIRMSQWSEDEELFVEYSVTLDAPWQGHHQIAMCVIAALVLVILWAAFVGGGSDNSKVADVGGLATPRIHSV